MKLIFFIFFIGVFFIAKNCRGQESGNSGSIKVTVHDSLDGPIYNVTLLLYTGKDTLLKAGITDTVGDYLFQGLPFGEYYIKSSKIGYKDFESNPFYVNDKEQALKISLDINVTSLAEVVISTNKPFIERKADKIVLNLANSIISSAGNLLEALKKAPGITDDQSGNIRLNGKSGVRVMINGRMSNLSTKQINNILATTPSSMIDKIEIISNPSSKYEAEGSAGIINIIYKKHKQYGIIGSISSSYTAKTHNGFNGAINLNINSNKFHFSVTPNFSTSGNRVVSRSTKRINNKDSSLLFDENTTFYTRSNTYQLKSDLEYDFNKTNSAGLGVNLSHTNDHGKTPSSIKIYLNNMQSPDSILMTNQVSPYNEYNFSKYAFFNHDFDSTGSSLKLNFIWDNFHSKSFQQIEEQYFDDNNNQLRPPYLYKLTTPVDIEIKSLNLDWVHFSKNKKSELDVGVKSSFASTSNSLLNEFFKSNKWEVNNEFSGQFFYHENVNALYINLQQKISKKLLIEPGIRIEQTLSYGKTAQKKITDTSYVSMFPDVFFTYQFNDRNTVNVKLSRRIDRPTFQNLNPFISYINQYTYFEGNPFLKPQFSNSVAFTYLYKNAYSLTLNYTSYKNAFGQIVSQIDSTKVSKYTFGNFDHYQNLDLDIYIPINIKNWLESSLDINLYNDNYNSDVNGGKYTNSKTSFDISLDNIIHFAKSFSFEIAGRYISPYISDLANVNGSYWIDGGISKSFFHKKLDVNIALDDILKTHHYSSVINYQNIHNVTNNYWESRRLNINLVYKFGSSGNKAIHKFTPLSAKEENRIKRK